MEAISTEFYSLNVISSVIATFCLTFVQDFLSNKFKTRKNILKPLREIEMNAF